MKPKFKLNNSYLSPEDINYDIQGLHKKRMVIKGELTVIEYYKEYNGAIYSDLVVKEERVFNRDIIGLVTTRNLTITWYLEDDSIGCKKNTIKYYSPLESIEEGIYRRTTIIGDAKLYALSTIGQTYGFDLMNSLKAQIDLFKEGYTQPLRDGVNASTKPYLTLQHKIDIIAILTY